MTERENELAAIREELEAVRKELDELTKRSIVHPTGYPMEHPAN